MTKRISPTQRRWITVVLTIAVAFLSGHLMQSNRTEDVASRPVPAPVVLPEPPVSVASLGIPPSLATRILETRADRKGSCKASLTLDETATGFLSVVLEAPCHTKTAFALQLNELTASAATDARGRWEQRLPALAEVSTVHIELADLVLFDQLRHEYAASQQHIVLAWSGSQTFRIRVDPWSGTPAASAPKLLTEEGVDGTFTRVGDSMGKACELRYR